jgi:hypothetical protein
MRVLVACEFSGVVRESFRKRGHDAWSCDLLPAEDGSEFHIQDDVLLHLKDNWDLMIAHPPCDRLLVAGALHWKKWKESGEQQRGIEFFLEFTKTKILRTCVENPVGIMSGKYRKPDQIINPYEFGHPEQKRTCLWLKNLPLLESTKNVHDEMMSLPKRERERIHHESPGIKNGLTRSQRRSITYQGIAEAMADQWGRLPVL